MPAPRSKEQSKKYLVGTIDRWNNAKQAEERVLAAQGVREVAALGLDGKNGWRIYRRDRRRHASPNSAQTESACAGLLGVRLGGDAVYHGVVHRKPWIGDPLREIRHADIPLTCRLLYATALPALALCCAIRFLLLYVLL